MPVAQHWSIIFKPASRCKALIWRLAFKQVASLGLNELTLFRWQRKSYYRHNWIDLHACQIYSARYFVYAWFCLQYCFGYQPVGVNHALVENDIWLTGSSLGKSYRKSYKNLGMFEVQFVNGKHNWILTLCGHRWIPRTKVSDAELWCFLWSAFEQKAE